MHNFAYASPASLAEALAFLSASEGAVKPLAGGTCLVPQMRHGDSRPDAVLSLKKLREELTAWGASGETWRLGALTSLRTLAQGTPPELGLLREVAGRMCSPEVRNLATVGGNLCNASPVGDLYGPLLALGATVEATSEQGTRTLAVRQLFKTPHKNALAKGELLTAINVPTRDAHAWGFSSYATHPVMGTTLVSAACVLAEDREADVSTGAEATGRQARLGILLASGRPTLLEVPVDSDPGDAEARVTAAIGDLFARNAAKAKGCHFAREHPQHPYWYLEHRAKLAAAEALAQAFARWEVRT